MPKIKRIDHVAIVVEDIDSALVFWRDALGMELDHVEDILSQEVRVAFLPVGESDVELVQPTSPDSGIARYLDKHGPGMHHICLQVDDIDAMLTKLKTRGVQLINPEPITNSAGKKLAFIHPKSTHGVLVELYQLPEMET